MYVSKVMGRDEGCPDFASERYRASVLFLGLIILAWCPDHTRVLVAIPIIAFLFAYRWPIKKDDVMFWSLQGFADNIDLLVAAWILVLSFFAAGILCGKISSVHYTWSWYEWYYHVKWYFFWGLFQQILCMKYFAQASLNAYRDEAVAAKVVAGLFSAVHAPNLFLMVVTGVGGYVMCRVYYRHRNAQALLLCAACHAIVAAAGISFLPVKLHAHFRIGISCIHFWQNV